MLVVCSVSSGRSRSGGLHRGAHSRHSGSVRGLGPPNRHTEQGSGLFLAGGWDQGLAHCWRCGPLAPSASCSDMAALSHPCCCWGPHRLPPFARGISARRGTNALLLGDSVTRPFRSGCPTTSASLLMCGSRPHSANTPLRGWVPHPDAWGLDPPTTPQPGSERRAAEAGLARVVGEQRGPQPLQHDALSPIKRRRGGRAAADGGSARSACCPRPSARPTAALPPSPTA